MSERAFWKDGSDIELGLMEAVPVDGNATRETTANGINDYYDERQEMRNEENEFRPRFFSWFEDPTYAIEVPKGFKPNDEELKLKAVYGLNDEQLAWRRTKTRGAKRKAMFPQEYPANEDEAFIASGNPYFDNEKLADLAAILQGKEFDPVAPDVPVQYANLRRERSFLKLWEMPQPGRVYVIGADTAEGLNHNGDHDYDSASVWDAETEIEVAHLHGRWDTRMFGLMLAELGFWYNTALLGVERNNHGHAVLNAIIYEARYPEAMSDNSTGLYMHQEYDEKKAPTIRKAGYPTTVATKYFILDELATAVEDGAFHPRSRELVGDMMRFVKLPGGKAGGEGKTHDDRVMDAAIARRMLNLRPRHPRQMAPATPKPKARRTF
jgi:hypothetical protein